MTLINKTISKNLLNAPEESINNFNLVYVQDHHLSIKRIRKGKTFYYLENNQKILDKLILKRINDLVIPPMWNNTRISKLENGHLQAVGRDAKGRKQYRYHNTWQIIRNNAKFFKMISFGNSLPKIRAKIEKDLQQKSWTKTKVLALIVKLLEETHIRIGNQQYAKRNKTYGLTTLRNRHLTKEENKIRLEFKGKRGKEHKITIKNKKLVKLVNKCQEIPGWELFQYYDINGNKQAIDSSDVNEYLHKISGNSFTAKDFRTWSASLICFNELLDIGITKNENEKKKNILSAIDVAAKELGNTRNVSRQYYIHPEIFNTYNNSTIQKYFNLAEKQKNNTFLTASEKAMLRLIENYSPDFED